LIDKSLLRRRDAESGARYLMLETVRQYALERLHALGEEDEVRLRHGRYFLDLAEGAKAQMAGGPGEATSFEQLEREHDNLRTALAFVREREAVDVELRLCVALSRFWHIHGHLDEGRRALESALAAAPDADPVLRARALNGAGVLAGEQGDFAAAAAFFELSLELARSLDDHARIAGALANLGNLALFSGDSVQARLLYEEGIAEASLGGAAATERIARENLGLVALDEGDLEAAVGLLEESAARAEQDHDERAQASSTRYLAAALIESGDHERARQLLAESLTLARRLGEVNGIAYSFDTIAGLAAAEGEPEKAALFFGAADLVRSSIGALRPPDQQRLYERWLAQTLSQLDAAAYAARYEDGRLLELDEAYERALAAVSTDRAGQPGK
jgi:tetratricopeptide (TPR) repeat protein